MQKINKVLAAMLVMALCSNAELGAPLKLITEYRGKPLEDYSATANYSDENQFCIGTLVGHNPHRPMVTRYLGGQWTNVESAVKENDQATEAIAQAWDAAAQRAREAGVTTLHNEQGSLTTAQLIQAAEQAQAAPDVAHWGISTDGKSTTELKTQLTSVRDLMERANSYGVPFGKQLSDDAIAALEKSVDAEKAKYTAANDKLQAVVKAQNDFYRVSAELEHAQCPYAGSDSEPAGTEAQQQAVAKAKEALKTAKSELSAALKTLPKMGLFAQEVSMREELARKVKYRLNTDNPNSPAVNYLNFQIKHCSYFKNCVKEIREELAALKDASQVDEKAWLTKALAETEEALARAFTSAGFKPGTDLDAAAAKISRALGRNLTNGYRKAYNEGYKKRLERASKRSLTWAKLILGNRILKIDKELTQLKVVLQELKDTQTEHHTKKPQEESSKDFQEWQKLTQELEQSQKKFVAQEQELTETHTTLNAQLKDLKPAQTPKETLASAHTSVTAKAAKLREKAADLKKLDGKKLREYASAMYETLQKRYAALNYEASSEMRYIAVSSKLISIGKELERITKQIEALKEALDAAQPRTASATRLSPGEEAPDTLAPLKAFFAAEAEKLEAKAKKLDELAADLKKAAAKAAAGKGWTYKQIIGFNVGTYLAATIAQNMLEGYVGVDIKGKDKRTRKQKTLDALKAIVALKKHNSHVVELYRTFKPAPTAEGQVTPKLAKRLARYIKAKPFFAAGLGTLAVGNGYMIATSTTMKKLVAKVKPAPKA